MVPDRLAVTAVFGEVVLDLREALLQSQRITLLATVIGGTLQLIVPEGIVVEMTGTSVLTRQTGHPGRRPPGPGAAAGTGDRGQGIRARRPGEDRPAAPVPVAGPAQSPSKLTAL